MECIICSEEITAATGRTVLGCGHEFHAVCVARWFCRQEGASSCPCCRKEAGQYEDVTRAGAAEASDDEESDWGEDAYGDEDDEAASVISVDIYWRRDASGVWQRAFREKITTKDWDPASDPDDVPEELVEGAVSFQKLWRGYLVRHRKPMLDAAAALITLQAWAPSSYA